MGNPPCHFPDGNMRYVPPEKPRPPFKGRTVRRQVYKVFLLRERDAKLPADRVRQTMQMGYLKIVPDGEEERAVLYGLDGTELRRLCRARTRRMQVTGDLLLRGIEIWQMRLGVAESRQAWWCELQHESNMQAGAVSPSPAVDAG
jgi:hypothetical protein